MSDPHWLDQFGDGVLWWMPVVGWSFAAGFGALIVNAVAASTVLKNSPRAKAIIGYVALAFAVWMVLSFVPVMAIMVAALAVWVWHILPGAAAELTRYLMTVFLIVGLPLYVIDRAMALWKGLVSRQRARAAAAQGCPPRSSE